MSSTELNIGNARPNSGETPPRPNSSLRSISIVTALSLVQLLLQFALQLILAKYFGAGREMDAYVAAMAWPTFAATILAGSLGYVLIPVLAEELNSHTSRDAALVATQVGLIVLGTAIAIAGGTAVGAVPIVAALCPGFTGEERQLTAELLRALAVLIVANSLISYLNPLFHAYRRFALPAIAGVVGVLATPVYVLFAHERQGIMAVAWGVDLGALITVAMLAPLFVQQVRLATSTNGGSPAFYGSSVALHSGTRQCLRLLIPLTLGAVYWRLDPLLDRWLGSYLAAGSIAHFGYAWRIVSGLMLIGTSGLSVVAFSAIAAHAAARRTVGLNSELAHAIRFCLFLVIPVTIGLVAFREPVVRLLFEHGRFAAADTQAVAMLMALYAGAVLFAGLGDLLSRTCYAYHDSYTPVIANSLAFTAAAAWKIACVGTMGAAGLAWATSGFQAMSVALLAAVVLWRQGSGAFHGALGTLFRAAIGSLAGCAAAEAVLWTIPATWSVLLAAAVGAAIYLLIMWLLRDEFARRMGWMIVPGRTTESGSRS